MIIYNVTIKVNFAIQNDWLVWVKNVHIPDVLNTGCFSDARILQLLETDDTDGVTYAIQFYAESKSSYNMYIKKFSVVMQQKSFDKWGDQFIAFMSVLRIVN